MIVVADAGPLHYLLLLDKGDLLPTLFGEVLVPITVQQELLHPQTPAPVKLWMASAPPWVRFVAAKNVGRSLPLGDGEREAIALAVELNADLLLVDDKKARRIAQEQGLAVAGTLGLLKIGHERGLLDLPMAVRQLLRSGFRVSEQLLRQMFELPPETA